MTRMEKGHITPLVSFILPSMALNQLKSLLLYWLNQSNIKLFLLKVICVHILNWGLPITNILGVVFSQMPEQIFFPLHLI